MARQWSAVFQAITVSERLADLPDDTSRLFYTWLLVACDPWGRITARPRQLRIKVWPMLDHSAEETERAAKLLEGAGLVELHDGDTAEPWYQIPDWEDKAGTIRRQHQRGPSDFPLPSDSPPEERRGKERKGDAVRGDCPSSPPGVPEQSSSGAKPKQPPPKPRNGKPQWSGELPSEWPPALRQAWEDFARHRVEIRKPLTPVAGNRLLAQLERWGHVRALAALEHTMANGWQGVREPEGRGPGSPASASEEAARRERLRIANERHEAVMRERGLA